VSRGGVSILLAPLLRRYSGRSQPQAAVGLAGSAGTEQFDE